MSNSPGCFFRRIWKTLDLRFEICELEAHYRDSLQIELLSCMRLTTALQALVVGLMVAAEVYAGSKAGQDPLWWVEDQWRITTFSLWCLVVISCTIFGACASLRLARGWFCSCDWEKLAALIVVCQMVLLQGGNQLWGEDTAKEYHTIIVVLDAVVTCVCLSTSFRICIVWIVPAMFICLHTVVSVADGSAPDHVQMMDHALVLLVGTMALASAWRLEKYRRCMFVDYLNTGSSMSCTTEDQSAAKWVTHAERRILRTFCDAIVHLDANLELNSSCPELARLLCLPRDLDRGTPFLSLLVDEERSRVLQLLRSSVDHQGGHVADMRHSKLKASDGSIFNVRLSYAASVNAMGELIHTIGISHLGMHFEKLNEVATRSRESEQTRMLPLPVAVPLAEEGGWMARHAEQEGDANYAFVSFNAVSPEKRVVASTPNLARFVGSVEHEGGLMSHIVHSQRSIFEDWLLRHVHDAIFGPRGAGASEEFGELSLTRRDALDDATVIPMLCRIDLESMDRSDIEDSSNTMLVTIKLRLPAETDAPPETKSRLPPETDAAPETEGLHESQEKKTAGAQVERASNALML
eukprot:TRINITY_DN23740_c0_g6_i1.p1 TRINITY_DN23740_c0_g6~~TRINITY_DN23740_c0_g6_i1.p1  ORF type:complete len:580 (+),score=71.74 TRINITY_DN23740_c0_g6_i1:60-1799(+)